jgi:hypothetical protein
MPRFVFAALAVGLSASFSTAEEPKPEGPKAVKTQEEALREARDVDLKLLEKADRVVLVPAGPGADKKTSVTVKGDDVATFRKALAPKAVDPSGGITSVKLQFYQGDTLLRSVWMFSYGEWGFERPGTHWTIGNSDDLPGLVRKHLK